MGEVGFLYYQQETGITTVVNFTSLPETRLVCRFFRRSSTTCVSSPYPAICQKDYSVTPISEPSLRCTYYSIKKGGVNPLLDLSSSSSKFFFKLDSTVGLLNLLCFYLLAIVSVILDTTVCDLCHLVSPKVMGGFNAVPSVSFCVLQRG